MKRKKSANLGNKRVKLILILVGVALLVAVPVAISLFSYDILGKSKNGGELIAKVNDEKIYKSEVETKLKELLRNDSVIDVNSLPSEILEAVVKNIYVERELDKKIKKEKLLNDSEIKRKTQEYALRLARQNYLELMIKKNVTPEAVRSRYSELTDEIKGKKEIHLKHILLKSENEAKKITKELKTKNFESLAKKYSIDNQTGKNGGDLGYVVEDNIIKEFSNFISSAKKGSVSSPMKTKFGWHIVKVFDIRDAKPLPFESVKDEIEEELKRKESEKFFGELVGNIKVEFVNKQHDVGNHDPKEKQSSDNSTKNDNVDNNSSKLLKQNDIKK